MSKRNKISQRGRDQFLIGHIYETSWNPIALEALHAAETHLMLLRHPPPSPNSPIVEEEILTLFKELVDT